MRLEYPADRNRHINAVFTSWLLDVCFFWITQMQNRLWGQDD